MHIKTLAGCAVLCVSMLTASAAMAQSADQWGGMTCADFTALDASAQNDFVAAHVASTPDNTLSAPAASSTDAATGATASSDAASNTMAAAVPGTDASGSYTAGQLVAACQAAAPTSTLQDALSQSTSGSSN